jgi:general secretion pathway protein H
MACREVKAMTRISAADASGFTLLEMMVVLAIVLIATGLIIPNLGSFDNKTLDAEVHQAVAVLKYTRRVAIVQGREQTAHFTVLDPQQKDYPVKREQLMAARKSNDWISDSLTLEFQSELNQPAEQRDTAEVVFFPQGGSTGGVLSFARDKYSSQIRVDAITGRISAAYRGEKLNEDKLDAAF